MQKARVVFHTTDAVRQQILRHGLIDPARLVQAPYGIAEEFTTQSSAVELPSDVRPAVANEFILHVGSCIPRKRIDVLLDVFAELSKNRPDLRLIQAGGEWTAEQSQQIDRLGIGMRVTQLPRQNRSTK